MKRTLQTLLLCLGLASAALAGETNAADEKWRAAVEKLIARGNTSISTPFEKRVAIAKQVAAKAGRKVAVTKVGSDYRITVL